MSQSLISPELLTRLQPSFLTARCTIQGATITQDIEGDAASTWANGAGLVDIPCAIGRAGGTERRGAAFVTDVATHTILLAGYYPTITPAMRAVSGANTYDILAVTSDPTSTVTALDVRQVVAP